MTGVIQLRPTVEDAQPLCGINSARANRVLLENSELAARNARGLRQCRNLVARRAGNPAARQIDARIT